MHAKLSSDILQVLATLGDAARHRYLRLTVPLSWVVEGLVRLVQTLRVSDLALQEQLIILVEVLDACPICPLRVCVHVHFHDAMAQALVNLLLFRARASVEDEVQGLRRLQDVAGMHLEGAQQLGPEHHIAGLVHAVHVAEGRGDRELLRDGCEGLVDLPDFLRGGVELVLCNARVVDAVFHSAGEADLHLENQIHLRHPLQVLGADADVLFVWFLGEVEHVAREQRLAPGAEEILVVLEHAVEPREQLFRTVV
mmetsp:Transcript_16139/g.44894  ORF Transcript_16139/g.44894 Transcript_16139/m.44894 type:complete len:254 (-) Transcript_16139:1166-1927(-)